MTKVAILPVPTEKGGLSYQGVAGDKRSEGDTPGQALDALTRQLSSDQTEVGFLIVVEGQHPAVFLSVGQKQSDVSKAEDLPIVGQPF